MAILVTFRVRLDFVAGAVVFLKMIIPLPDPTQRMTLDISPSYSLSPKLVSSLLEAKTTSD